MVTTSQSVTEKNIEGTTTCMSDSWIRFMDSWYGFLVIIDVNPWRKSDNELQ
jgi:RNA polymerase subunit RPABC4/transcription elongation factor Spt4